MKKNKKGFTLVELLAVIVILAIISTLGVVLMNGSRQKINVKMIESNFDLLVSDGATYGQDNITEIFYTTKSYYVSELKEKTNLTIDESYNNLTVKVYIRNNRPSACIAKDFTKLHELGLTDDDINDFSRFFCTTAEDDYTNIKPKPIPGDSSLSGSAKFASGSVVRDAIDYIANQYLSLSSSSTFTIKLCNKVNISDCPGNHNTDHMRTVSSSDSDNPIIIFDDGKDIYYYTKAKDIYLNEDASYMFSTNNSSTSKKSMAYLTGITGIENWITTNTTNMSYLFSGAEKLYSLDLSSWNTKNVTNMAYMFSNNRVLGSLTINKNTFTTSKVTSMDHMFYNNKMLTSTSLFSNFDTSKITDMQFMFYGCNLNDLSGLSNWNVSNVTTLCSMFEYNENITSLSALSGWNVSKVYDINGVFEGLKNVTTLEPLRGWKVGECYATGANGCSKYTYINIGAAFKDMKKVTSLEPISAWPYTGRYSSFASKVGDVHEGAFEGMSGLTQTGVNYISNWEIVDRHVKVCINGISAQFINMFKGTVTPTLSSLKIYDLNSYTLGGNNPRLSTSQYSFVDGSLKTTTNPYCS